MIAHYAEYLQTFTNMAAAVKAMQRSDGFWNVNLGYTNDYPGPESSGTACFTYGLAWGINHGYLDTNTYLPAVINGWNALAVGALHHSTGTDNGFLGYEQGSGSKPADGQPVTYTSVPDFDDFGLGLFLLAGSQIYALSSPPGIVLASPVLAGSQVQLNFTVISSLTNATLYLLQTDQPGKGWTTNTAAMLTTNVAGISYCFTPRTMRQPGSIGLRLAIDVAHCCARLRQQGAVLEPIPKHAQQRFDLLQRSAGDELSQPFLPHPLIVRKGDFNRRKQRERRIQQILFPLFPWLPSVEIHHASLVSKSR